MNCLWKNSLHDMEVERIRPQLSLDESGPVPHIRLMLLLLLLLFLLVVDGPGHHPMSTAELPPQRRSTSSRFGRKIGRETAFK